MLAPSARVGESGRAAGTPGFAEVGLARDHGHMAKLYVEQRRGEGRASMLEAVHPIHAVLSDADGRAQVLAGEDLTSSLRSAGKPVQLEVSLAHLPAATHERLGSRELALGAASHAGERFHVSGLERLFSLLGVHERDLLCGAHAPSHAASAQALYARGEQPTAVHNNCAGKHAFMAAASRAQGFAIDYRPRTHPLQQAVLARVGELAGEPVQIAAVDGCGVPCPALRLSAMARVYAAIARAMREDPGSRLAAIAAAMRAHPLLVSGSEAFDGWLMQHSTLLAKVGALGLLCIADAEQGVGIAIKVESGSDLARPVAAVHVLERLLGRSLAAPLPARYRSVRNVAGLEVGEIVTRSEAD